jgi:uncharacterized protein YdbL (DUF1318 family)
MKKLTNDVFGELIYENLFWRRLYLTEIFGKQINIQLVVDSYDDADDGSDITTNQREAFLNFEKNKKDIIEEIEQAVLSYYKKITNNQMVSFEDIREMVNLKYLKVIYTEIEEDRELGFIFDASFDPELGIGVLVSNERVVEVGVQDIVL